MSKTILTKNGKVFKTSDGLVEAPTTNEGYELIESQTLTSVNDTLTILLGTTKVYNEVMIVMVNAKGSASGSYVEVEVDGGTFELLYPSQINWKNNMTFHIQRLETSHIYYGTAKTKVYRLTATSSSMDEANTMQGCSAEYNLDWDTIYIRNMEATFPIGTRLYVYAK